MSTVSCNPLTALLIRLQEVRDDGGVAGEGDEESHDRQRGLQHVGRHDLRARPAVRFQELQVRAGAQGERDWLLLSLIFGD